MSDLKDRLRASQTEWANLHWRPSALEIEALAYIEALESKVADLEQMLIYKELGRRHFISELKKAESEIARMKRVRRRLPRPVDAGRGRA